MLCSVTGKLSIRQECLLPSLYILPSETRFTGLSQVSQFFGHCSCISHREYKNPASRYGAATFVMSYTVQEIPMQFVAAMVRSNHVTAFRASITPLLSSFTPSSRWQAWDCRLTQGAFSSSPSGSLLSSTSGRASGYANIPAELWCSILILR